MPSPLGLDFPRDENARRIPQYRVVDNKAVKSLFNGGQFSPYPTQVSQSSGSVTKINNAFDIHNDDANDLSTQSIIDYTSAYPAMKLDYAHFAYLKNLGVYPNNRLIIARRFPGGVANDLTEVQGSPMSTLVSWFSDTEEPFSIKFNEDWGPADGGFEDVLNNIGKDVLGGDNRGGKLGGAAGGAFGLIPLPGLMEGLQLKLFQKLGIAGQDQGPGRSPFGNPNLIREAKVRSTLSNDGKAGSGLKCDFQIKMTIEYEQKFINGVDPTLVYLDILQNALTFGTSESVFQFSSAFASGTNDIIKKLISGDINAIIQALTEMIQKLIDVLVEQVKSVVSGLISALEKKKEDKNVTAEERENKKADEKKGALRGAESELLNRLELFKTSVGTVISKYKVRLLGITNSLTGGHSTPWHVTIGNPKKPIFSSGDLLCEGVTITLGKVLAFNDLPSSIKLDVTFKNARGLGSQEIFNRFNSGRGRSYTRINKSFVEVNDSVIEENVKVVTDQQNKDKKSETTAVDKPPTNTIDNSKNETENQDGKPKVTEPVPIVNGNENNDVPDDYPVDFTKEGVEWGSAQSRIPQEDTSKVGDNTAPVITNDGNPKSSKLSVSDPNLKPEVKASDSSLSTPATIETPGVTQSTSALESQVEQGNTDNLPPPPDSLPAPPPREQEPEIVIEKTPEERIREYFEEETDDDLLSSLRFQKSFLQDAINEIRQIERDIEFYEEFPDELEDAENEIRKLTNETFVYVKTINAIILELKNRGIPVP